VIDLNSISTSSIDKCFPRTGEGSMFLHDKKKDALVKVIDLVALINPNQNEILGQVQSGEEQQDPAPSLKADLIFPSGENLPRCWVDADYRNP